MRLDTPDDSSPNRLIAYFTRLSARQWGVLLLSCIAVAYCSLAGWHFVQARRAVYQGRIQPPPETLEARRLRGSPFAPGMTRDERREAMKKYGKDFWLRTSSQEKVEVARGYLPRLTQSLHLTAEQQGPVDQVIENAIAALIPIWNGWWDPNFNRAGALFRSSIVAANARQQLEPLLNVTQKEQIDTWMAKAKERAAEDSMTTGTRTGAQAGS